MNHCNAFAIDAFLFQFDVQHNVHSANKCRIKDQFGIAEIHLYYDCQK